MINFRFHLVSLVAIFLALGVGVAMGASFVDRATVETLRSRLDQLEDNYRERGIEIEELHDHLRSVDEATAELLTDGSTLVADRLEGRAVAMVTADGMAPEAVDAAWSALDSAGAERAGTVRIEPAFHLDDEGALAAARELLQLESATPELVRGRLLARLGEAMALLTASEPVPGDQDDAGGGGDAEPGDEPQGGDASPGGEQPPDGDPGTTTTEGDGGGEPADGQDEFRPLGPDPDAEQLDAARAFIEAAAEAGLVTINTGGVDGGREFPSGVELTYVVLVGEGAEAELVGDLQRLASEIVEVAPATVAVVEGGPPRPPGELPDGDDQPGGTLVEVRNDDAAVERLSTVDGLEEPVGRIVFVLAVEQLLTGQVGHYGEGVGATGTVPRTGD